MKRILAIFVGSFLFSGWVATAMLPPKEQQVPPPTIDYRQRCWDEGGTWVDYNYRDSADVWPEEQDTCITPPPGSQQPINVIVASR